MPNTKISDLFDATTLDGTELVVLVQNLQDRKATVSALMSRAPGVKVETWTQEGVLVNRELSRWYPEANITLHRFFVSVVTAGGAGCSLAIKKNGSTVGTVVIAAGQHTLGLDLDVVLMGPEIDYLSFQITGADGTIAGLRIQPSARVPLGA